MPATCWAPDGAARSGTVYPDPGAPGRGDDTHLGQRFRAADEVATDAAAGSNPGGSHRGHGRVTVRDHPAGGRDARSLVDQTRPGGELGRRPAGGAPDVVTAPVVAASSARSGWPGRLRRARQRPAQLAAGPDAELAERVAQMPFDGAGAQEQLCADLGVGQPVLGEPGDGRFLGAHPPQPFAVEQVGAGQFGTEPGPAQPGDRLAVQLIGGRTAAWPGLGARLDAQRVVGARGPGWLPPAGPARPRRSGGGSRCVPRPRSARAAPRWRRTARGCDRWLAARRPARPGTGRGCCTGSRRGAVAKLTACPCPPAVPSAMVASISRAASASRADRQASHSGAPGGGRIPVASATTSASAINVATASEVTAADDGRGLRGQVDRRLIEGADGPGELGLLHRNGVPAVLVPQHEMAAAWASQPHRRSSSAEISPWANALAAWRSVAATVGRAVGDQPGQASVPAAGRPGVPDRQARGGAPGRRGKPRPDRRRPPAARRTWRPATRSGRSRGPGRVAAARAASPPPAAAAARRCPGRRRTRAVLAAGQPGRWRCCPPSPRRSSPVPARRAGQPVPSPAAPARRPPAARVLRAPAARPGPVPGTRAANAGATGRRPAAGRRSPAPGPRQRSSHCSSSIRQE